MRLLSLVSKIKAETDTIISLKHLTLDTNSNIEFN